MKVALFHTTLPEPGRKPGGVEVVVHRLANALIDTGACSCVTVMSLTEAPGDARYDHINLFSQYPRLVGNSSRRSILRWTMLPALLNFVDMKAFDLVHLHGDDWFFFNRSCATVRTLHGSALDEARTATSLKRKLGQYYVYPLEHLSVFLATVTLAVGPRTVDRYRADCLVDNGVDPEVFFPGKKRMRPTVLYVGKWEGRKRGKFAFDRFINGILPCVPEAEMIFVSDYCELHPSVHFVSSPSDAQLAQLYREAWILAYPSSYEGFGVPYIEAMSSGAAVVASPNPGASYVLENGHAGLIVDDRDFSHAVVKLITDDSKRIDLVSRGLERAKKFQWSSVAETHIVAYRRAIELWGQHI